MYFFLKKELRIEIFSHSICLILFSIFFFLSPRLGTAAYLVGTYDTPGNASYVYTSDNYAYIADELQGLSIVDISEPAKPDLIGAFDTNGAAYDVKVVGDKAYLADFGGGFKIIDISDPKNPFLLSSIDTPGFAHSLDIIGNIAYIADWKNGLQVIDISNPSNPQIIGSVDTPGTAFRIKVSENKAYIADQYGGLQIIDISIPENPVIIGKFDTVYPATGIDISGNILLLAESTAGLKIIDVSDPAKPKIMATVDTPGSATSVAIHGNRAYVSDGEKGIQIIDISKISEAAIVSSIDTPGEAKGVTAAGNYIFVSDFASGMHIITSLTPVIDSVYPTLGKMGEDLQVSITGSGFNEMTRVSMAIDANNSSKIITFLERAPEDKDYGRNNKIDGKGFAVADNKAYIVDTAAGLQIFDISNFSEPIFLGSLATLYGEGITVLGPTAYIAGTLDDINGLYLVDISNPASPSVIGSVETPFIASGVSVSGDKAYVADGRGGAWQIYSLDYDASVLGGLQVIDISNPAQPEIIAYLETPGAPYDVIVRGDLAYEIDLDVSLHSGYRPDRSFPSTLNIIDISNPLDPVLLSSKSTLGGPMAIGLTIDGDRAYIANGSGKGLLIMDISDPFNPVRLGSVDATGSSAFKVDVSGDRAFLADINNGIHIIDISDEAHPTIIGTVATPDTSKAVKIVEGKAFVADDSGLVVLDINSPTLPPVLGTVDIKFDSWNQATIFLQGDKAYIEDRLNKFQIVDTSISPPAVIGTIDTGNYSDKEITVLGDYAYITSKDSQRIMVFDISDSANPAMVSSLDTPSAVYDIAIDGGRAYIADGDSGLQVIDISNPAHPVIIASLDVCTSAANFAEQESSLYSVTDSSPYAYMVDVVENIAYVKVYTKYGHTINIIDVSVPSLPVELGIIFLESGDSPSYMVWEIGGKSYRLDGYGGLQILDTSGPFKPVITGNVKLNGPEVFLDGAIAYLTGFFNGQWGLHMLDISDPVQPFSLGRLEPSGILEAITVSNGKAYIFRTNPDGLVILPLPAIITPNINSSTSMTLTLPHPQLTGNYNLTVYNYDNYDEQIGAVSFLKADDWAVQNKKKAIIVAGGGAYEGNSLWPSTKLCANYAYKALQAQGYGKDNVKYLSAEKNTDADGDGAYNDVTAATSLDELRDAITGTWAKGAIEVMLYITDHGGDGTFRLNDSTILTAEALDAMLDDLQSIMAGKVIIIYDACQSGSFISKLTPPAGRENDRVIIASAASDETAKFVGNGTLSFSYQFWSSLRSDARLLKAWISSKKMMEDMQSVLIEANGNGIPNEMEDYAIAFAVTICRGNVVASTPPKIGQVVSDITLNGETSASIWAKNIEAVNGIDKVIALINPPGYDDAPLDIPVTDYPTVELTDPDGDGTYSINYTGFDRKGDYDITIMAMDKESLYSLPIKTKVTQNNGSTLPLAMATPKGGLFGASQEVRLVPSEQSAKIHYSLSGTPTINDPVYTNPISIAINATLKFMPVSSTGKAGSVYTETYQIDSAPPAMAEIPSDQNAAFSYNPYPVFVWSEVQDADYYVLQFADNDQFDSAIEKTGLKDTNYSIKDPLPKYGIWHWRVAAVDTAGNQAEWATSQYEYKGDTKLHKAIIIAGGDPASDSVTWATTEILSRQAYEVLEYQGYTHDTIQLLSADSGLDINEDGTADEVDADSTKSSLQDAITNWAADADDLLLFFSGPATADGYKLSITETLTAIELDSWLDNLQATMPGNVLVIYDADYSGSFVAENLPPTGKERIFISSAGDDELAWFLNDGVLSFSYQFWSSVFYNGGLYESFQNGRRMVKGVQMAILEANANGKGNEKSDWTAARDILIGQGRRAASTQPEIGFVSKDIKLEGTSTVPFWARNITGLNSIERVFAVIKRIDLPNSSAPTSLPTVELSYDSSDAKYKASYDGFTESGLYSISIYAVDSTGLYSIPREILVAKDVTLPVLIDIDNDGVRDLEASDITSILVGKEPARDVIDSLDIDGDGRIGLEELIKALQNARYFNSSSN